MSSAYRDPPSQAQPTEEGKYCFLSMAGGVVMCARDRCMAWRSGDCVFVSSAAEAREVNRLTYNELVDNRRTQQPPPAIPTLPFPPAPRR